MRKVILSIVLLLVFTGYSQIKNGIITYKKEGTKKVFEKKNTPHHKNFNTLEKGMYEAMKEIELALHFTPKESRFERVKTLKTENDKYFQFALIPHRTSVFYSNPSKNVSIEQKDMLGETFLINKEKLNWKLTNNTKKIGKYTCFKATTIVKREYRGKEKKYLKTAWYCPEINVPFGPIGYGGLPGLILELTDGPHTYKVKKIELNTANFKPFKAPKRGKKIAENKMSEMIKEAMGDFKKNKGY